MVARRKTAPEKWGSRTGFVLAAVGSAVGLGNIWRFPYMAYDNGGGAFLVPYLFAVLTAGIPLMIMEFCLGKRSGRAAPGALAYLGHGGRMLGWWQVVLCFSIMIYYSVVLAWAFCYIFFAIGGSWGADPQAFFFKQFLGTTAGPLHMGRLSWMVTGASAAVWAMAWLVVWRGIHRGIELACKIFIPILAVLLLIMLLLSFHLPGATEGINWLFQPDFSRLGDFRVWADAYSQVFYSASVFFAIMIAYSSYLPKHSDLNGSAVITICLNSGFSLLAGTMIFAIMGYLAHSRGAPVDQVVSSGISMAFITLPMAIDLMPLPRVSGVLFFIALFVAGFSSAISLVEAAAAPLMRATGKGRHATVSLVCLIGFAGSLVFTWGSGIHLIDVADHFLSNYGLIGLGLVEVMLFAWISGKINRMRAFTNATSDFPVGGWWNFSLRWINPAMLAVTLFFLAWGDLKAAVGGELKPLVMFMGVGLMVTTVVAAYAAYRLDPNRK